MGTDPEAVVQYGAILIILSICLALLAWWRSPARRSPTMRILGLLMGSALLVETVGLLTLARNANNQPMYNAFNCMEFVLVLGLARMELPQWKRWLSVAGVLGILAMGLSLALRGSVRVLLLEGMLALSLILTVVCLTVLWNLADKSPRVLWQQASFWMFTGLLFYHVGLLPIIGLLDVIADEHPLLLHNLYIMVQLIAVVCYLCLARCCQLAGSNPLVHDKH